jgi:hypothetical protein
MSLLCSITCNALAVFVNGRFKLTIINHSFTDCTHIANQYKVKTNTKRKSLISLTEYSSLRERYITWSAYSVDSVVSPIGKIPHSGFIHRLLQLSLSCKQHKCLTAKRHVKRLRSTIASFVVEFLPMAAICGDMSPRMRRARRVISAPSALEVLSDSELLEVPAPLAYTILIPL